MADRPELEGVHVYTRGRRFWFSVECGAHPLTGERIRERRGGWDNEAEAWKAALDFKTKVDTGSRAPREKRTARQFKVEWMSFHKDNFKPSTWQNYNDMWEYYVLPHWGDKPLLKLGVKSHNALYSELRHNGRIKPDNNWRMYDHWSTRQAAGIDPKPKEISDVLGVSIHAARHAVLRYRRGRIPEPISPGLAPKTIDNIHRMLRRAWDDGTAWGYIDLNPAKLTKPSKVGLKKHSGPKGATWTRNQLIAWLKVAITDRDSGIWVLAATTGARRSELAGAERALLNLEEGVIDYYDTRVVVDGQVVDSDGKTEASRRTVALDGFTIFYLRRHLEMLDREAAAHGSGYNPSGKLVVHEDGRPVHPDTITDRFNRLVDRAGVPRIRLHDVRHTYATLFMDEGGDPKILADRLGHATMDYTLRLYTHRSTGQDREAAQRMAETIFAGGWAGIEFPQPESAVSAPVAAAAPVELDATLQTLLALTEAERDTLTKVLALLGTTPALGALAATIGGQ